MPDWLTRSMHNDAETEFGALLVRLFGALAAGLIVAGVYRFARRHTTVTPSFPPTLVLLALLVAVVTQVIGDNVARAFGLVGALSIVRFRTVVEDTYDIAYVIFAVVIGMAIGASHWKVGLGGLLIVSGTAVVLRPREFPKEPSDRGARLSLRIGLGHEPEAILLPVFGRYFTQVRLTGGETGGKGAALDLTYAVRFRPDLALTQMLGELNRIEGVQHVELRCD